VSSEFVKARTEASLYYPGSHLFWPFWGGETWSKDPAFAGAILTSSGSPAAIYQWYHNWLATHGWHQADADFNCCLDTQTSLQGYERGSRELFYVAMSDPRGLSETLGGPVPRGVTVFEIRYTIMAANASGR
jgi:hypothetical protein